MKRVFSVGIEKENTQSSEKEGLLMIMLTVVVSLSPPVRDRCRFHDNFVRLLSLTGKAMQPTYFLRESE